MFEVGFLVIAVLVGFIGVFRSNHDMTMLAVMLMGITGACALMRWKREGDALDWRTVVVRYDESKIE